MHVSRKRPACHLVFLPLGFEGYHRVTDSARAASGRLPETRMEMPGCLIPASSRCHSEAGSRLVTSPLVSGSASTIQAPPLFGRFAPSHQKNHARQFVGASSVTGQLRTPGTAAKTRSLGRPTMADVFEWIHATKGFGVLKASRSCWTQLHWESCFERVYLLLVGRHAPDVHQQHRIHHTRSPCEREFASQSVATTTKHTKKIIPYGMIEYDAA